VLVKLLHFFLPITSKYFRLSVYLVGNSGSSGRNNFVINELTLNQNTANSIAVPTLISNKTTFTADNELVSKQYVDSNTTAVETKTQNQTAVAGDTTFTGNVNSTTFVKSGGLATEFLKANGTVDTSTYATNPTYNSGVSTLNNALSILPMTSDILPTGYIALSSGHSSFGYNWQAFDLTNLTIFTSYPSVYNGETGVYIGVNTTSVVGLGNVLGDWLQIEYPSVINVSSYTIDSSGTMARVPSTFYLLYSNDGTTWIVADTRSLIQWVSFGASQTFTLSTSVISKYFRLSVSLAGNTGTVVNRNCFTINELILNQNTAIKVNVPCLISNKKTFTLDNELVSKSYVSLTQIFSTFAQFTYYGSIPTANSFNMASGTITNIGGSLALGAQSSTNIQSRQYRVKSNPSSAADGQSSGWQGTISSPLVIISQGFRRVYSFSIEDTFYSPTIAPTRTLIGLIQSSSVPALNSTASVHSLTIHSCCIIQEVGESVFSFYTRGTSGFVKTATTISCATPNFSWYTLTIENQPYSPDITMILTAYTLQGSITATHTFTGGLTNTPSLTATNNVMILRSMAVFGGTVGSAMLSLGAVKMYNI
jgi:hypothetical protein